MPRPVIVVAQHGTRLLFTVLALATLCPGCDEGDTPDSPDAGRARSDASVDAATHEPSRDAAVDARVDAATDAGKCCPIDPRPDCCMRYGGSPFDGFCGQTCDGMPLPNDPRWKVGQDANGCPVWIEPEVIDNMCCGCPDLEQDAGG